MVGIVPALTALIVRRLFPLKEGMIGRLIMYFHFITGLAWMVNKIRLMEALSRTGREISGRNSGNINGQDIGWQRSLKLTHISVCVCVLSCFSHVRLCVTLWTEVHQAPLSMQFSRQEYWSRLPCPPPGGLGSNPGIEPTSLTSPVLAGGFCTTRATWDIPMYV